MEQAESWLQWIIDKVINQKRVWLDLRAFTARIPRRMLHALFQFASDILPTKTEFLLRKNTFHDWLKKKKKEKYWKMPKKNISTSFLFTFSWASDSNMLQTVISRTGIVDVVQSCYSVEDVIKWFAAWNRILPRKSWHICSIITKALQ